MKRWVGWGLVVLFWGFAMLQFVHRVKPTNPRFEPEGALFERVRVDRPAKAVLERSCTDCHSNETRWPWYTRVAPISWVLIPDVFEARQHLNFSEWGSYSSLKQVKLLDGMCEKATGGEMPLKSYLWFHREARLSAEDARVLCGWAKQVRTSTGR